MKILVVEDDFQVLKGAFDYLNVKFYNGSLEIENISKTQDFANMLGVNEYDKIFVDISLHRHSRQDGYAFIKTLLENLVDNGKVVIITGSDNVTQKLAEFELPVLKILSKPITYLDLKSVMPE